MQPFDLELHFQVLMGSLFKPSEIKHNIKIQPSVLEKDDIWNLVLAKDETVATATVVDEYLEFIKDSELHSLYLSPNHQPDNRVQLVFNDQFLINNQVAVQTVELGDDETFSEITDNLEHITAAESAFPEWPHERDYINAFSHPADPQDRVYKSYKISNRTGMITFGSAVIWPAENIAYMHNSGTMEQYRQQGYFTKLKILMLNEIAKLGVSRVYAITEEGAYSGKALQNLGFSLAFKYKGYQPAAL